MKATTVGIDLAKSIFAVCEGDSRGHGCRSSLLKGGEFMKWLRTLPTGTVVAMEACSSAHSWGRTMQVLGLEPRLIAAEFVRPYRKNQRVKNDTVQVSGTTGKFRPEAAADEWHFRGSIRVCQ